jgi:hypothetical protein
MYFLCQVCILIYKSFVEFLIKNPFFFSYLKFFLIFYLRESAFQRYAFGLRLAILFPRGLGLNVIKVASFIIFSGFLIIIISDFFIIIIIIQINFFTNKFILFIYNINIYPFFFVLWILLKFFKKCELLQI